MSYDQFNYGTGQTLQTSQDYTPNQLNAVGQSLSPTPLSNGAPIANDYSNDNRTAQDFKQQLRQANLDTLPIQDTSNKIVMKDGYLIDKTPDSRVDFSRQAAMAYGAAYLANIGDQGQAVAAGALSASQAYNHQAEMIKREKIIPQLEKTGRYNSLDLEKWRDTGDTKDLIANAGKWISDGQGKMHNDLTGEVKDVEGYQQKPQQLHYLKNDDGTYTAVNPFTNEVKGNVGTSTAPAIGSGGDIGLDEDESNDTPAKQGGVYGIYDKKGNFKPLGEKEQSYWRNRANPATAGSDPNQKLVSDDLTVVNGATDDQLSKITGQVIGRNETARDVSSSLDPETRKVYLASQRLSTQMGNNAIAAAKSAGASGINTEAEIKRFTQGVPQIDYTSKDNYKASVKRIQEYADSFRDQLIKQNGGKTSNAGSTSTGKDYSNMW